MLPNTLRHGSSVASWNTYPMRSRSTDTVPAVCSSRPEAILSRVDFPQPDGPTTVTNSPRSTLNEMLRSASVPSGKIIPMLSNDNAFVGVAATVKRTPSW